MDRANKIALCMQLLGYCDLCWQNDMDDISYYHSLGVQLKKDGTYSVIETDNVCQKYGFDPVELWDQLEKMHTLVKGERSVE